MIWQILLCWREPSHYPDRAASGPAVIECQISDFSIYQALIGDKVSHSMSSLNPNTGICNGVLVDIEWQSL